MSKARILTTVSMINLVIVTLFSLTFLAGRPVAAADSGLGITPTFTPSPVPAPVPTATPTPVPPPPAPPPPAPRLTITKSAEPAQVLPGGQVTFVIQVCNTGAATANEVIVSDALPPELEGVRASATQGTVTVEGNGVRAELGSLSPGACAEITIVARVRADVLPGTQIVNIAVVDGQSSDEVSVTVVGLLPRTGGTVPLTLVVGLSLLATGLALMVRNWGCRQT